MTIVTISHQNAVSIVCLKFNSIKILPNLTGIDRIFFKDIGIEFEKQNFIQILLIDYSLFIGVYDQVL